MRRSRTLDGGSMVRLPRIAPFLLLALLLVGAGLAVAAPRGAAAAHRPTQADCTNTGVVPEDDASAALARKAILCLVNQERTSRGLRALTPDLRLRRIARAHSRDMVRRRYFDHVSPDGRDTMARLRAGHWRGRSAGENLAWGSGELGTPADIVDAWMHSPGHRANILRRIFRRAGVGVVVGAPQTVDEPAGTYTMLFDRP